MHIVRSVSISRQEERWKDIRKMRERLSKTQAPLGKTLSTEERLKSDDGKREDFLIGFGVNNDTRMYSGGVAGINAKIGTLNLLEGDVEKMGALGQHLHTVMKEQGMSQELEFVLDPEKQAVGSEFNRLQQSISQSLEKVGASAEGGELPGQIPAFNEDSDPDAFFEAVGKSLDGIRSYLAAKKEELGLAINQALKSRLRPAGGLKDPEAAAAFARGIRDSIDELGSDAFDAQGHLHPQLVYELLK